MATFNLTVVNFETDAMHSCVVIIAAIIITITTTNGAVIKVHYLYHHHHHHPYDHTYQAALRKQGTTTVAETINWSAHGITSWNDIETALTSTVKTLDVSSNDLKVIAFTQTFQNLQMLFCFNTSLTYVNVQRTNLETLSAYNNLLSSFQDVVLTRTIQELDLSANWLSDWKNLKLPRDLQTLNLSHNSIADISGSNLSAAVKLVSIDLSSNMLTSVVGVVFPSNLMDLDLSGNRIHTFEVYKADFAVLSNLATFKMDDLEQSTCSTSSATIETIKNVQICVITDAVFTPAHLSRQSVSKADKSILYASVILSALISLWFLVLLVGHAIKMYRHGAKTNEQQRDTMETSTLTASRHWSVWKEDELPNDVRFDEDFISYRIDPSDVMQIRTLAHGNFAILSLVHLGDKQAVMKKVSIHPQGQDRDQMIAFMHEIRVCAKLDHPMVVRFLGIMWSSLFNLASIVEYVPLGNLAVYLKEMKSLGKNSRSTFTWMESSNNSPAKLSLSLQISKALVYLQTFVPPVIHGHIRAESMLLGSEWNVKVNRLGYTHISSLSIEDRAWIAPEVLTSGTFDEKSDIYSFGVLLSELDRCKLPFSRKQTTCRWQCGNDAILLKPKFCKDCPLEILEIAQTCLNDDPSVRPTARELYDSLWRISHQSQGHSPSRKRDGAHNVSV
ncbi:unnamed protein product [Peronospora belbahrii]|uniref:Protein kinase domain-containing protein n=1 Tax=Peronospora belbahrii TaxID=622444 RepID=A0ABN8D4B1_9STRA|nr:unnamed protein product [Peronospora belbahrii]